MGVVNDQPEAAQNLLVIDCLTVGESTILDG